MLPVRGKPSLKGCFHLKKLAKLFALILALALVLTLAACKKDATEVESVDVTEQYLGAYRMDSINGVSVRDAMLLEYGSEDKFIAQNGMDIQTAVEKTTLTLKADFSYVIDTDGTAATGTWTVGEDRITLTSGDNRATVFMKSTDLARLIESQGTIVRWRRFSLPD